MSGFSFAQRHVGAVLMFCAALAFSTGGLLVRSVSEASAWNIVFWRSLFMCGFLCLVLGLWYRTRFWHELRSIGWSGCVAAAFVAVTFICFVMALEFTTVANTSALMSTGPLILSMAAWIFLGERAPKGTWLAIAAALNGIALMFSEGLAPGALLGNALALCIPLAFAANYIIVRRTQAKRGQRTAPTVVMMLAAGIAALAALPFAQPLRVAVTDFPALLALGVLQTGMGCLLLALAMPKLTAAELSLIGVAEPVLAPLWVWLLLNERPGNAALIGSALVISAVIANQILTLRARPTA